MQAHRQRLKESGVPAMKGGRVSSTPRPSKGVTDWSRSQTERGGANKCGSSKAGAGAGAGENHGAATARESKNWDNDAVTVARLTALADTLSDNNEEGVHDALAAELRTHGPLPPGVVTTNYCTHTT